MDISLIPQTLLPALLAGIFAYLGQRCQPWIKLHPWARHVVIGVAFGLVAVFDTQTGLPAVTDSLINARDAAPVAAALCFGGPAGVIAGVIGGVWRWFYPLFFMAGLTTRTACTAATVLAGIIGGLARRRAFGNRTPATGYAVGIAMGVEAFHMMLILLISNTGVTPAFVFVDAFYVVMIAMNGFATGLAVAVCRMVRGTRRHVKPPYLISDLGNRLVLIIIGAFFAVTVSSAVIILNISSNQTETLLYINLDDLQNDVETWGWDDVIDEEVYWRIQLNGSIIVYENDTGEVLTSQAESELYSRDAKIDSILSQPASTIPENSMTSLEISNITCYVMKRTLDDRTIMVYLPCDEADYYYTVACDLMVFTQIIVNVALVAVLYRLLYKRVIRNLHGVGDGLNEIAAGNLNTVIDVRTHQEFSKLSDNVNTTVDTLKGYIEEAEHRHDAELELARHIQHSALPSVFPPFPERHDFDIYASMEPAREVGGDFYDFFMLDSHRLVMLIADVSGKGVPAALFMMQAKTEIHSLVESGLDVDAAFTETNRRLCEANESGMFVTAWLGILDLTTGMLSFANAGHNPPLVRRAGGDYEYLRVAKPNFFLAGMDGIKYRKYTMPLFPGDRLFLYTDGVTEACNPDEDMYGEHRLLAVLNGDPGLPPHKTCETIATSVHSFANGAEQSDDITMLCVSLDALCGRNQIVTHADIPSIDTVRMYFEDHMPELGASRRVANRVLVAVDEIYSNICNYSHATRAAASIVRNGNKLVVEFVDNGDAFDPTQAPEPDTTLSAEERKIGGLGIHMVRTMSESMEYARIEGTNVLTVTYAM